MELCGVVMGDTHLSTQLSRDNAERTLLRRLVLIVHKQTNGRSRAFMVTGFTRGKTSWHVVCREEIRYGSLEGQEFDCH